MKVTNVKTQDIRFPTSKDNLGSDAVHVDCDYSATYVTIETENADFTGIGSTFTIGKGNDLCCKSIEYFKEFILGKEVDEIEKELGLIWEKVTNHSQLRWVGPQKGVTHLAAAAFFNAIWDLISKIYKKPLWRYIIELETEELLDKLSFSYIDDVITKKEAAIIIDQKKQDLPSNIDELNSTIFPAYTTSPDDIIGFRKIKDAHPDIKLATGEMIQNKVIFKQFIENKSLDYCQIDSCRIASINEILPVLLIASKFNTPVIPHAGGIGLCEYVQHLNLINKFIITNNDLFLSEYAESCSEHFDNPAIIKNGGYVTPTYPGYSVKIKDSSLAEFDYNNGTYWN